ncbi:MAG: ABC transporter permease, partial [Bdellovibrionota bacterium]
MIKRILSLFDARNKEFYRDTSSLAWNFLFPIVVVFGFAFAFSSGNQNIFKVAVHRDSPSQSEPEFLKTQFIQFVPADDLPSMIGKLERHQVDMVVSLGQPLKYWLNSSSPKSYLLERIL